MNKTEFINELAKRTDRPVTEMYKFVNDFLHSPPKSWHVKKIFYFWVSAAFLPVNKMHARYVTPRPVLRLCFMGAQR